MAGLNWGWRKTAEYIFRGAPLHHVPFDRLDVAWYAMHPRIRATRCGGMPGLVLGPILRAYFCAVWYTIGVDPRKNLLCDRIIWWFYRVTDSRLFGAVAAACTVWVIDISLSFFGFKGLGDWPVQVAVFVAYLWGRSDEGELK